MFDGTRTKKSIVLGLNGPSDISSKARTSRIFIKTIIGRSEIIFDEVEAKAHLMPALLTALLNRLAPTGTSAPGTICGPVVIA
jgi:hypothetical protein